MSTKSLRIRQFHADLNWISFRISHHIHFGFLFILGPQLMYFSCKTLANCHQSHKMDNKIQLMDRNDKIDVQSISTKNTFIRLIWRSHFCCSRRCWCCELHSQSKNEKVSMGARSLPLAIDNEWHGYAMGPIQFTVAVNNQLDFVHILTECHLLILILAGWLKGCCLMATNRQRYEKWQIVFCGEGEWKRKREKRRKLGKRRKDEQETRQ